MTVHPRNGYRPTTTIAFAVKVMISKFLMQKDEEARMNHSDARILGPRPAPVFQSSGCPWVLTTAGGALVVMRVYLDSTTLFSLHQQLDLDLNGSGAVGRGSHLGFSPKASPRFQ